MAIRKKFEKPLDKPLHLWYNEYRNKGMGTLGKASQAVV